MLGADQAVEARDDIGVVGAERLLEDLYRPLCKRQRLAVLAFLVEDRDLLLEPRGFLNFLRLACRLGRLSWVSRLCERAEKERSQRGQRRCPGEAASHLRSRHPCSRSHSRVVHGASHATLDRTSKVKEVLRCGSPRSGGATGDLERILSMRSASGIASWYRRRTP